MTETDVDRIESSLAVTLPDEYRRLLMEFPSDLSADWARHEIFCSADWIIKQTQSTRLGAIKRRWPTHMIVIGDSGCGDFYCLDLSDRPASVVCWDHEKRRFEFMASSIEQWHKKVTAKST